MLTKDRLLLRPISSLDLLDTAGRVGRKLDQKFATFMFAPASESTPNGVFYIEMIVPEMAESEDEISAPALKYMYFWTAVYIMTKVAKLIWGANDTRYLSMRKSIKSLEYVWEVVGLGPTLVAVQFAY